ncbi:hypothetical protein V6N13_011699 [Hibiscus sabdariffa]
MKTLLNITGPLYCKERSEMEAFFAAQSNILCHVREKLSLPFGEMEGLVLDHWTLLNKGLGNQKAPLCSS